MLTKLWAHKIRTLLAFIVLISHIFEITFKLWTYLNIFKIHFAADSDMTWLALPAILNKQFWVNNWTIPCSMANPNSLAHNDVILHASFITTERKSESWISKLDVNLLLKYLMNKSECPWLPFTMRPMNWRADSLSFQSFVMFSKVFIIWSKSKDIFCFCL